MARVFKTKAFAKWARKAGLVDEVLCRAVDEMEQGLIDVDLGGGVVKKRVALPGRGKSGSTRTLAGSNKNDRWFFLYGFEKNERDNITDKELQALQKLAEKLLALKLRALASSPTDKALEEICHEKKPNS